MPLPWFPPTDTYLRFFENQTKTWEYRYLAEREGPIRFNRRFASLAVGTEGAVTTLENIRPDTLQKKHMYAVYLGLYPGFLTKLYYPVGDREFLLDTTPTEVNEELVSVLSHEFSPHDDPKLMLWLDEQRYFQLSFRNVGWATANPAVTVIIMKYRISLDAEIPQDVKAQLATGQKPSLLIALGGRI